MNKLGIQWKGMLIVGLLLVSILAVITPVSAAGVALSYGSGISSKTVNAGDTAEFTIIVENNQGSNGYCNFTSEPGLPTDWTISYISDRNVSGIADGSTGSVNVQIKTNTSSESGQRSISLVCSYGVAGNPPTGTKSITVIVEVRQKYGLELSATVISASITPPTQTSASFSVRINNTGNGVDTVNISKSIVPINWILQAPGSRAINPFNYTGITVTASYTGTGNPRSQNYYFEITTTSQDNLHSDAIQFTVYVTPVYEVSLLSTDTVKYLDPASSVQFNFNVTNKGNALDTFSIELNDTPVGWNANPSTNPISSINPDETRPFSIIVTSPTYAAYNDQAKIYINVTSVNNITKKYSTSVISIINKKHNIELNPIGGNSVNVEANKTFTTQVEIRNRGNTEDTVRLEISGEATYLTVNFNLTQVVVPKDSSQLVNLSIIVNSNAPSEQTRFLITAYPIDVPEMKIYQNITVKVNQKYDVLMQVSGANTKYGDPSKSVNFTLSVKNKGNGIDTVLVNGSGLPANWNFYFTPATVNDLAVSEVRTVTVTVDLPKDAQPNPYTMTVRGTSDGNGSAFSQVSITVIANQFYSVEMSTVNPFAHGVPEGKAYFNVTIRNKGSGVDTFTMSAAGTSKNWITFNVSSFSLAPEQQRDVQANATIPKGTLKGDYIVEIIATSSNDTSKHASVNVTTIVDDKFAVEMWTNPSTLEVEPGKSVVYMIYIKNRGNVQDQFFVNISDNPNLWAVLDLGSPFVTLQPDTFTTTNLTVTVPSNAVATTFTVNVSAVSQADGNVKITTGANVIVKALYGLQVTGIITQNEIEPTETVEYVIKVSNTGNSPDTFNIDLQGANRTWGNTNATVYLLAKNDTRVYINITIPDDKLPGTYLIPIKVTSQGNDSKTQAMDLTVIVVKKHDITIISLSDVRVTIAPSGTYVFDIKVTNIGPDEDTVDLNLTGPYLSWATLSKFQLVNLGANVSQTITLSVHVPSNALPEVFVYYIKATENDKHRFKWLNLTVEVDQIHDIYLSSNDDLEKDIAPGTKEYFNLTVKNIGSGQDTYKFEAENHMDWVTFLNSTSSLDVNGTTTNKITVTIPKIPLPQEGDYDLIIRVVSLGNETIWDNMTFKVTITQVYDVKLTSNVSVTFVDPGFVASYNLTIENKGNGRDTFVMKKTGDNPSWVQLSSTTLTLTVGQKANVLVTIQIPSNEKKSTMYSNITVESQGSILLPGGIKNSTVALITNINLVYGVEVTPSAKAKVMKEAGNYTFPISIKNTGSDNDEFIIEALGAKKEWVNFNRTTVSLAPDKLGDVNVTLAPAFENPFDELNGTYTFDVKVSSAGFSFKYAKVTVTLTIDVQYGFDTSFDKMDQEAGPGEEIYFNLTIRNLGNIDDEYQIVPLGAQSSWAKIGTAPAGEAVNTTVGKSGSRKLKITVNVPTTADSNNAVYNIELKVTSRGNDTLEKSKTHKITVNEAYAVTLEAVKNNLNGGPGMNVSFEIEVKNTGNVPEDIDLEIVNDDNVEVDDWATLSVKKFEDIAKDNKLKAYVYVLFPNTVTAGNYVVKLKATPIDKDGNDVTVKAITLSLTTKVIYAVNIDVRSLYQAKAADAGSSIEMQFTIENLGTADETFDVFVDYDNMLDKTDVKEDWNITIREIGYNKPDLQNILIPYDSIKSLKTLITIAPDAKNQRYVLRIKAASKSDEKVYDYIELYVDVNQFAKINVTVDELKKDVDPGTSTTFTMKLKNEGNAADTYNIDVEPIGGPYEQKNWWTLTKTDVRVDANSFQNVGLGITPDVDAEAGNYTFRVKVKSDFDDDVVVDDIFVTIEVKLKVDFDVTTDDASETGKPGESKTFTVKIENFGNADDEYDFEWITSPDREKKDMVTVEFDRLEVPYDDKREFKVYVNLTDDVELSEAGDFTIELTVNSLKNDTKSKKLNLKMKIEAVYNNSLSWDGGSRPDVLDPNDQDIEFTVKVKNWGNSEDLLTFDVDPPVGWQDSWFSLPSSISIKPMASKDVTLKVRRTSVTEERAGTYRFNFFSISKDGETESDAITINFKLVQWNLAFTGKPTVPATIKVGDTVDIDFTVENNGEADSPASQSVDIMVGSKKMATGKIDAVANGESSEFTISWTPSEAVEGSLSLVLRDVEGQKVTSTKTPVKVEKSAETGGIGDIGSSSTMMYVGIAVLIIIILVIAMAMAGKKKPTSPPGGWAATAPPPKQTTMPKARPAAPQVSAAAAPPPPSGEPGKVKIARIKCPKCKEVMDIKSSKRPLEVRCDNCNAKLLLKK